MNIYVLFALIATLGTWLVTALGAATVVFFKSQNQKTLNIMLGFASGVMIAASFWSLLQPAIEKAEKTAGIPAYLVATIGFLFIINSPVFSQEIRIRHQARTQPARQPNQKILRVLYYQEKHPHPP